MTGLKMLRSYMLNIDILISNTISHFNKFELNIGKYYFLQSNCDKKKLLSTTTYHSC